MEIIGPITTKEYEEIKKSLPWFQLSMIWAMEQLKIEESSESRTEFTDITNSFRVEAILNFMQQRTAGILN